MHVVSSFIFWHVVSIQTKVYKMDNGWNALDPILTVSRWWINGLKTWFIDMVLSDRSEFGSFFLQPTFSKEKNEFIFPRLNSTSNIILYSISIIIDYFDRHP